MSIRVIAILGAAVVLLASAVTANAAPILDLELERPVRSDPTTPLTHSDERAVYLVRVKNTASPKPTIGDELTCLGTPADGKGWFFADSFAYQWMRNGQDIVGATARTYTLDAADSGKAIQCVVEGTKASTAVVSASGEGTINAGSNIVTGNQAGRGVTPSAGNGTLTSGSNVITGVSVIFDRFFLVGQTLFATGIPAGTTITAVGPGTLELSAAATASGVRELRGGPQPFEVGQLVLNSQFPAGTTITEVTPLQIKVSANATENSGGGLRSTTNPATLVSPTAAVASQPPVVVEPQPATAPPAPTAPTASSSRPTVQIQQNGNYLCDVSAMSWSGSPVFTRQWLRDGEEIVGATGVEYTPTPTDKGTKLQCRVTGTNAGGAAVAISSGEGIKLAEQPVNVFSETPTTSFSNTLLGADVDIELPGGQETYVLRILGTGWSCTKEPPSGPVHATANCTRADQLAPGATYPDIEVVERPGRDAPDVLTTRATVSGGGAADPASAEDSFSVGPAVPFGFKAFETKVLDSLGNDYTQAGGHPFSAGALVEFNEHVRGEFSAEAGFRAVNGYAKIVRTETPRGFVGNVQVLAANCASISDVARLPSTCPPGSVVGGISVDSSQGPFENLPIFSIKPEYGAPAQFGFAIASSGAAYSLTPELRAEDGYAITLITAPVQKNPELFEADVTLCGFGAKLGINSENGESEFQGCRGETEPGANAKPFITNPTRCSATGPTTRISANTWEEPNVFAEASFTLDPLTGCDQVKFEPAISLVPTSKRADAPTGMDVELSMPTAGLESNSGIAQANLANSTVTLPVGMALNPSLANGLAACGPAQIGLGSNADPTCPESSKVGTVEVDTPLLENTLKGNVYVAQQTQNPFKSLLAIYLVFASKRDGITIKVAGKVSPDPATGQLTASFKDNPEAPFSRLALHFTGGDRAPLITPPECGTYAIVSELSPWTAADPANPTPAETVEISSEFKLNRGPDGGACPEGTLDPKLQAGVANPQAGASSPFTLNLRREDGTQRFSALQVTMPPGLTGSLKGIPTCPDSALAAIPTAEGTGQAQFNSPVCPASQLGSVSVAAGAGPFPYYANTGRAYLAGPYKGAPLSIAIVTPALAGPFDLGNVVVRNALYVNPKTTQISVVSDPIPTILHGLLLDVREIRVNIDRPNFIIAPTNCEPMSVGAQVGGEKGGLANLSSHFQVGGCENLPFKPNLKIQLHGKTRRGAYQRLIATVTAKPGEANIARTAVTFPHSAFLAQEHIVTICTRAQFAAEQCPKGSIYGRAKAVTPLLEDPLTGPVYLRSNPEQELPDLVAALRGPDSMPIKVELSGRTDSKNAGIRNTFDFVPDAPVTKFTLEMNGGRKSLIVNSRNLCKGVQRATVRMTGQNGKLRNFRPVVHNDCKKKKKSKGGKSGKGK